jgi:hypothetical protein
MAQRDRPMLGGLCDEIDQSGRLSARPFSREIEHGQGTGARSAARRSGKMERKTRRYL